MFKVVATVPEAVSLIGSHVVIFRFLLSLNIHMLMKNPTQLTYQLILQMESVHLSHSNPSVLFLSCYFCLVTVLNLRQDPCKTHHLQHVVNLTDVSLDSTQFGLFSITLPSNKSYSPNTHQQTHPHRHLQTPTCTFSTNSPCPPHRSQPTPFTTHQPMGMSQRMLQTHTHPPHPSIASSQKTK